MDNLQATRELLRIVGHRISTPLTDILQIADAITYGADEEVSLPIREEILKIRASAEQVLIITDQILGLVSVESLREIRSSIDIIEVIRHVHSLTLPLANAQGRDMILEIPSAPIFVTGNSNTLQQALHVIFTNAIQFAQSDVISISVNHDQSFAAVSVHETQSVGLQEQTSIGDFLRVYPNADLSLDLLLCHCIAAIASGKFWLTSEVDLGNIGWHMTWPLQKALV